MILELSRLVLDELFESRSLLGLKSLLFRVERRPSYVIHDVRGVHLRSALLGLSGALLVEAVLPLEYAFVFASS